MTTTAVVVVVEEVAASLKNLQDPNASATPASTKTIPATKSPILAFDSKKNLFFSYPKFLQ